MKINLLGISASPRKANSYYMLEKALEKYRDSQSDVNIEVYSFQGKKILPCTSCYRCWEENSNGRCILNDDFGLLKDMWIKSDVVIYSVPVYHLSIPAQLKAFWDRLGNSLYKTFHKPSCRHLKTIGCITQGMHLHSGQELTIQSVIMHAVLLNCIPVSGDGWQSYTGASAWTLLNEKADALQNAYQNPDVVNSNAMIAAESVVARAITIAEIIKNGGMKMQKELIKDPRFQPFISRL